MSTNLFQALKALFPGDSLLVATVLALHTDGTLTVGIVGGGQQRVRGNGYALNDKVFVRNGMVEGPAPSLPAEVIEV